jgi:hypothetical protein
MCVCDVISIIHEYNVVYIAVNVKGPKNVRCPQDVGGSYEEQNTCKSTKF